MKKRMGLIFGFVLVAVAAVHAASPFVSNVRASQRAGTKLVDVWYDVSDADEDRMNITVGVKDGTNTVSAAALSGDIGTNLVCGTNKKITWNAGTDWSGNFSTLTVTVTADDGQTPVMGDYMVIDLSGGTNAASYPVTYLTAVPSGGWTDEYKTTKLVMRKIPAGSFTMGSPAGELGRSTDETQHTVTLTKDFYIGVFEVTQRQWELVMGNKPSYFTNAAHYASRPVEQVSYHDIRENPVNGDDPTVDWPANSAVNAASFMGKLRSKTGLAAFDLPTESQWEYACRAGTTTALNSGKNLTWTTISDANMAEVGRYYYNHPGGYSSGSSVSTDGGTAKAGSYLPNSWGLYDMHGNVWELCLDWHGTYPGTVSDPLGAASGSVRVLRGGRWSYYASHCRSADRAGSTLNVRDYSLGFRAARTLP